MWKKWGKKAEHGWHPVRCMGSRRSKINEMKIGAYFLKAMEMSKQYKKCLNFDMEKWTSLGRRKINRNLSLGLMYAKVMDIVKKCTKRIEYWCKRSKWIKISKKNQELEFVTKICENDGKGGILMTNIKIEGKYFTIRNWDFEVKCEKIKKKVRK